MAVAQASHTVLNPLYPEGDSDEFTYTESYVLKWFPSNEEHGENRLNCTNRIDFFYFEDSDFKSTWNDHFMDPHLKKYSENRN